jgi:dimeric dUTPase (all-alpha-NTP-PPase superfamily)
MNRITKPQLVDMLTLQNTLNQLVNPDWLAANYAWARAIRVECAELSDHLGWKWWKKQEPNLPQAQIEMVDIWHFMLSHTLNGAAQGDAGKAADEILNNLVEADGEPGPIIPIANRVFVLNQMTMHERVDLMGALAGLGYSFPAVFERLMADVGLTWETLHKQYVAKNVLNIFRQRNGYKDGTYIKDWHGEEDNVHLERFMVTFPDDTPEQLLDRLGYAYGEVLVGRTMA